MDPMADDVAKEGFERTADHGAAKRRQGESVGYLESFITLIEQGKTILDVGCGDGIPVDDYLVKEGFALNGIDVSPAKIEQARKNVPDGFFEVKDLFDLRQGEYCVDGVVSLHALAHIPREKYHRLLSTFASFMANGGALLVALRPEEWGGAHEAVQCASVVGKPDEMKSNTELLENAGFAIISSDIHGPEKEKRQIFLARS